MFNILELPGLLIEALNKFYKFNFFRVSRSGEIIIKLNSEQPEFGIFLKKILEIDSIIV